MSNPKETLKKLYQALTDRPLDPEKDKAFFEPDVEKLPDGDPMRELLAGIDYSESESLHLVSRQRGTGKSTKLLRLKKLLEDAGYVVFYLNILEYLSESEPVEITDFLLAATSGLAAQAKEKYGFDTIHESYWERMRNFLESEIGLENISGKGGVGGFEVDLQALLKRDPSFKRRLQQAARNHIVKLSENVQQFVIELVRQVRQQPGRQEKQIVFIGDSVEQIRGNAQNAGEVRDSMVRLFGSYGEHLHLPQLHFVITVPPYLTTAAPGITRLTQSNPVITLPSIHIRSQEGQPDIEAQKIMRAIVHRRSPEAGTIFTESAIDELTEASGAIFGIFSPCCA